MSKPIQFQATLDTANRRKDRSISVKFTTMTEMTTEEFAELDKRSGQAGWCLFKANEVTPDEIPTVEAQDERKTPSQRLHSVLFIYWKQLGEPGDFNQFYRTAIERYISGVKEKLE